MISRSIELKLKNTISSGLASCAAVYGYRQVTPQLIEIFFDAMQDVTPDAVDWAFGEWLRTGQRFPTPAAIRELATAHVSDSLEAEQRQRSRHARVDQRPAAADPAVLLGLQRYRAACAKVLVPLHTETAVLERQIGLIELGRGTTAQRAWVRRAWKKMDFEQYSPEYRRQCAERILREEQEMSLLSAEGFIAVARLELSQQGRAA